MDVLTILSTLVRRWLIVVAVLTLTAVAIAGIVVRTEPTYEMRGSFLATERVVGEPGGVQPDPEFAGEAEEDGSAGGDVPAVLNLVLIAEAVQDGEVVEEVHAQGGAADFQVQVDGELLRVLATDSDRATVVPTVTGVLAAIEDEVAAVQAEAGVPEGRQAVVERVAVPSDASVRGERGPDDAVEYSASGSVRVVGPGVGGYNPYAQSGFTVRVLEEVLAGEAARARVADAGGTGEYSIEQEDRDTAPIVYLAATGASAEEAERTFTAAREVASEELGARQAALGAPEGARVGLFELSVPSRAQEISSGLARPLITVAGLGAAAAVGLALLTDNLLYGLRRRREKTAEAAAGAEADQDQERHDDETASESAPAASVAEDSVLGDGDAPAASGPAVDEPVSDESPESEPEEPSEPDSDSDSEPEDEDQAAAAGNGNGNGMAGQAREAMYLAVLDKVFGPAAPAAEPPVRELLPRTPTDPR